MQRPGVTAAEEQALKNPLACSAFPVIPVSQGPDQEFPHNPVLVADLQQEDL